MNLDHLSDDELESKLMLTCFQSNKLKAHILVYLIGIENRRIDRRKAFSSMYDYCKRQLGMSGGQAYRRIAGARLVRRFPFLLERIEQGEVHLTTLTQIASFITNENVHELVDATVGKNRDEVDRLLGKWFGIERTYGLRSSSGIPVDDELAAMIKRARELLSHSVPNGDPLALAKKAFALLIDQAERKTRGKADKPRRSPAKATKKTSRAVMRETFERDGDQCSYVDEESGRRCPSRAFIELDHIEERALGGSDEAWNRRPLCGRHNRWLAELTYGREHVERCIRQRRQKRTPRPSEHFQKNEEGVGTRARARGLGPVDEVEAAVNPPGRRR